jgi:hypothetical protein
MDIVDLRDIIENRENEPETYDAWAKALMEDTGDTIETVADNEPRMIPEWDFVEHAQELAEDLGLTSKNDKWPLTHIDWRAVAKELKRDYVSITVGGRLYYYRRY